MEEENYYIMIESIDDKLDILANENKKINSKKMNEDLKKYLLLVNEIDYKKLKLIKLKLRGNKSYNELIERDIQILNLEEEKILLALNLGIISNIEYNTLQYYIKDKLQKNNDLLSEDNNVVRIDKKLVKNISQNMLEKIG